MGRDRTRRQRAVDGRDALDFLARAHDRLHALTGARELPQGWEHRLRLYQADGVTADAAVERLLEESGFFADA